MSIFRKCHIKLFFIIKVGDSFWLWLHFYSAFEFPPKSVFYYFGLPWARLEKCIVQSAENFKEQRFHFVWHSSNFGTRFSDFSDSRPKKIGFLAWGRVCMFFVQKIIDLFTVLQILYKFWKMFHTSFSYVLSIWH